MLFQIKDDLIVDGKPVARNMRLNHDSQRKGIRAKCEITCNNVVEYIDLRIDYSVSLNNIRIKGLEVNRNIDFDMNLKIPILGGKFQLTGMFGNNRINQSISSPMELFTLIKAEIENYIKGGHEDGGQKENCGS